MTARHSQKYHLALICALSTALVAGALMAEGRVPGFGFLRQWEMQFRDFLTRRGRPNPADPRLVFLGIDNESVSIEDVDLKAWPEIPRDSPDYRALTLMTKQWPWPREIHALLLDKLCAAGARMVVFDLLFLKPTPDDESFRAALDRHRDRVVIGSNFVPQTLPTGMEVWTHTLPSDSLVPQTQPLDPRVAVVNFWPDNLDGKIRRTQFRMTEEAMTGRRPGPNAEVFLSLAARTVSQMGLGKLVPAGPDKEWLFRYSGPPSKDFRPRSIYQVFVPRYWKATFADGAALRDKIVIIGSVGDFQHDEHETPFGMMAGPEIHLNAINALLHDAILSETSFSEDMLLVVLAGAAAYLIFFFASRPVEKVCCGIAGNAMGILIASSAYNYFDTYVGIVAPLLAFNLSAGSAFVYKFVVERLEKVRTRRTFERYVSRDVVRELLDNREGLLHVLGGTRRPVTVLFSDLRGFTTLTESSDPEALVAQLNEYFQAMVRVVFAHHGTLDKFMGDGLMAHWGSIVSHGVDLDARNAVRAALEMRAVFAKLNADWKSRGLPVLEFGVGLNSGEAIVGNMGCDEKMEVSLMGDAVNLASRIEGTTKPYHVDILIGAPLAALIGDKFVLRTVDTVRVKGKTTSVEVFAVLAEQTGDTVAPEWLEVYEEAVRCYRAREFARAAEICRRASKLNEGDYLIAEYLRRSESLALKPPSPGWSGIQILDQK